MNKPTSHLQGDKKRLITLICLLLFAGFMAVSLLNYYVSKSAIREALISRELPLTSDNVYSEIQKDLVRPVFISSMMAHDTFLRDWVLDNERGVDQISRYLQEIKDKYAAVSSLQAARDKIALKNAINPSGNVVDNIKSVLIEH